ncbi:hypothetical protein HIC20_00970 [Buchnera aphidicola (Hormaphis cornu)]|nr:hypothetical protein HIC20_00970 [Buchnera aphidicola (Hormaphis cornu)]
MIILFLSKKYILYIIVDISKKQIQNHHQLSQISNNTSYIKHIHLQILSQIINNILINNYIKKLNFKINVSLLQNKIYKMPIFQINHHFNRVKYLYILNNINIFPKKYENLLIQQLNTLEFLKIIKNSEFILNYEKNFYIKNFFQIRTINKITLSIKKLIHKQHIKTSEINKYLKKYNFDICNPETFKIAFIQIKCNKLKNYTNTKQITYWYNKNIFKNFNKKNKIYSIIHILLNKKESLKIYHHLQLTIKNIIKSRNTTLKYIQKKINPNISVANWFSKKHNTFRT